jgi:TPR repeat protein
VNPLRPLASERGEAWDSYAAKKRAYDAQRAADSARLRKVLPLKWVSDWVKLDLVERYARAYGAEGATALVPSARIAALREKAALAIACEGQDADKCGALARLADEAKEPRVAVAYLDRACAAGSAPACSDAGNRFLVAPTRDVERAVPALRRGCDAKNAEACARLARVYEEGDTGKVDLAAAADLRDKACAAGDGASCRRLACLIDTSASAAAKAHAEELWGSGCAAGDAQSCALVRAARAGAGQPVAAPLPPSALDAAAHEYALQRRQSLGIGLLAIGTVLGTGAAAIAFDQQAPVGRHGFGRRFERNPPTMAYVLGAGAVVSVGVGIGILLSKPEEPEKKVTVGVTPNGILLSGPLP